jgi:spore coat protein A
VGEADDRGRPEVGQVISKAVVSRRALLAIVGTAGAAVVADRAGLFGGGGGNGGGGGGGPQAGSSGGSTSDSHEEWDGDHHSSSHHDSHHNSDHGDWEGSHNDGGYYGGHNPNDGITEFKSEIALPPPFRRPLPIPQELAPSRRSSDTDYYEIVQSQAKAEILPGVQTRIWGFNGTFPGPTIVQKPNRRVVVRHRNALPVPTVVHLHGGTTPHDSDGYPTDFVLPAARYGTFPVMPAMAGMPAMNDPEAEMTKLVRNYVYPSQPRAATLWYHDHRMDFTGPSVYRGLAGFHLARDREEEELPLPKGRRDVPLMIADRAFAADGSFLYPSLEPRLRSTPGVEESGMKGVMGDVILVNGAPWPVMKVDTARYRFRILNASNARTYQLALEDPSRGVGFTQIGTDHGLLAAPLPLKTFQISGAQRFDVVIDFSKHKVGDEITMVNRLGSGSTATVMRFIVARATDDKSSIPSKLSTIEKIAPTSDMTRRFFKFHRGPDDWTINDRVFEPSYSQAEVKAGSTELWTVLSDFHHPFHIHNATIQVISRDHQAPGPYDQGWKDTVFVNEGEQVELAIRFADFDGRYVFHCHNLEHEDMGMMANFRIA